jgi:starch phosphorylase
VKSSPEIAYFSMEVALAPDIPTYSGGLGMLAGDHLRSAADLEVPLVGITLLHRQGYFRQRLDAKGNQREEACPWNVGRYVRELPARVAVQIEGRSVAVRAWQYDVPGPASFVVPVLLLDTDLPENSEWDRHLTDRLYGGDSYYRFCQEIVLGIGGIRMLRALGLNRVRRYHMNEGHAALLALELLDTRAAAAGRARFTREDVEQVRAECVFTTHTPVPAGHDKFALDLVGRVLARHDFAEHREVFCCEGVLNLTYLALNLSHYHNGVARQHGEVSQLMFPRYTIDAITNGVHAPTWTSEPFQRLFDRHLPDWRRDCFALRNALRIPRGEVWIAHQRAKNRLIAAVREVTGAGLDPGLLTLGFGRRAAAYKRADLLFHDIRRLKAIGKQCGGLQIVYAGKAHPADQPGKDIITRIVGLEAAVLPEVKIIYLENYDMALGQLLTAGVDVWLNTPEPPQEASGTSGMKAALNGVPSLSVLDGWWVEGHIEGVTGWAVGQSWTATPNGTVHDAEHDAASLYEKLERQIIPLFCGKPDQFTEMMCHCIALNGSFFNTHRMVEQYVRKAYFT